MQIVRRLMLVGLAAAAVLAVSAASARAAQTVRYVDPSGADSGDCTSQSSPCETIAYAVGQAADGDAVQAAAGTYTVSKDIVIDKQIALIGTQSAGKQTVLTGSSSDTALIDIDASKAAIAGLTVKGNGAGAGIALSPDLKSAGAQVQILGNDITGNQTGILVPTSLTVGATLTAHANRIVANGVGVANQPATSGGGGSSNPICSIPVLGPILGGLLGGCDSGGSGSGSGASPVMVDATNNFWGCNQGPDDSAGKCDTTKGSNITSDPYLVLTAPDTTAPVGGATTVSASLRTNSDGKEVDGADVIPAVSVGFAAQDGKVDPDSATTVKGVAQTRYTASDSEGTDTLTATADNARATASVKVVASPKVTTGDSSDVGDTGAKLAGTVNPNGGGDTTYHFDLGTSTDYGSKTDEAKISNDTSDHDVTATLTKLMPGTTYHYRLVASNGKGTTTGQDATFTTTGTKSPPQAKQPQVLTAGSKNVGSTTATLLGLVAPNGQKVDYLFQFGPTKAYGRKTTLAELGADQPTTPVSASLTGLASGTTYHYRIVAVSATALIPGADKTFTTTGAPAKTKAAPNCRIAKRAGRRGRTVRVRVRCAARVTRAKVRVKLQRGGNLGSRTFSLPGGKTRRIGVRLNRRGAHKVRAAKRHHLRRLKVRAKVASRSQARVFSHNRKVVSVRVR
jgi:hypothetical protein